jgi:hypothetical protein
MHDLRQFELAALLKILQGAAADRQRLCRPRLAVAIVESLTGDTGAQAAFASPPAANEPSRSAGAIARGEME